MSALLLADAERTAAFGRALARHCPWSTTQACVLYLCGELGTGKTTLVRGLLQELGVTESIRSPSYSLYESYELCCGHVLHVDLYRLREPAEFESLGLREECRGGTLWLVEWPERGAGQLPAPDLRLELQFERTARRLQLNAATAVGASWTACAMRDFSSQI
jgi:tRNA threonylcarbamoyladenosine biosynthesis protein TsaE